MKLKYGSFGLTFTTIITGLLIGMGLIMLVGCEKEPIQPIPDNFTLEIDGRLDTTNEGYYVLELSQSSFQTIHRVSGTLLNHGEEPYPPQYVNWESSHEWYLSDTTGYVVRRIVNVLGQWTIVDTMYLTNIGGLSVPTINPTSVSGTDGEINTMIAPIYEMKGDTMYVKCTFRDLEKTIGIILQ